VSSERQRLLDDIDRGSEPLLGPRSLEHSQQLSDELPQVRHHLGPRAWYQALEDLVPLPPGSPRAGSS